jgi:ribosomal protein L11 methyltransferase
VTDQTLIRVVVVECSHEASEICADALMLLGAFAIEERNFGDRVELRCVSETPIDSLLSVLAPFDETLTVDIEYADESILSSWKDYASPVVVNASLAIVPAWLPETHFNGRVIRIDTVDAFGIGDHPTTRMCVNWLSELKFTGLNVLGTGLLAILAKMSGASRVSAVDIAESALKTTRSNAAENGVTIDLVGTWSDLNPDDRYDVVVANILAPVLLDVAPWVIQHLSPNGIVILSGIRDTQIERIRSAYKSLTEISLASDDGWVMMVLGRRED